jgi:hypothetical protein
MPAALEPDQISHYEPGTSLLLQDPALSDGFQFGVVVAAVVVLVVVVCKSVCVPACVRAREQEI